MLEAWNSRNALALAYAGSNSGVAATAPALRALRAALPITRLILLWPAGGDWPAGLAQENVCRIDYPVPDQPTGEDCLRTLTRLEHAAAAAAIVFSEPSYAPSPVAYLCCLAGIEQRAGYSSEFTGGIFTTVVAPSAPITSPTAHHLQLLDALGLQRECTRQVPAFRAPIEAQRYRAAP